MLLFLPLFSNSHGFTNLSAKEGLQVFHEIHFTRDNHHHSLAAWVGTHVSGNALILYLLSTNYRMILTMASYFDLNLSKSSATFLYAACN